MKRTKILVHRQGTKPTRLHDGTSYKRVSVVAREVQPTRAHASLPRMTPFDAAAALPHRPPSHSSTRHCYQSFAPSRRIRLNLQWRMYHQVLNWLFVLGGLNFALLEGFTSGLTTIGNAARQESGALFSFPFLSF
jgi:hypothetical protein